MRGERTALTYTCPDNVMSRSVGDELVLVELDRELYFSLNATGASIWSALQAGNDLESIVATLVAQGATPQEARNDIDQLIDQLAGVGLLATT